MELLDERKHQDYIIYRQNGVVEPIERFKPNGTEKNVEWKKRKVADDMRTKAWRSRTPVL
jgi:hypothetical protein